MTDAACSLLPRRSGGWPGEVAMSALQGLGVLVTRPSPQAEPLCRALRAEGAVPLRLPLLAIEAVADHAAAAALLARAGHYDWLIFTSANAVRFALPDLGHLEQWPRVAAMGRATAAALRRAGMPVDVTPQGGVSSEALLAHIDLRTVAGQRVLLVSGAGGRGVLAADLSARGAVVDKAAVYRRRPVFHREETVCSLLFKADVAIVTSGESLTHLVGITPKTALPRLKALQLVVPSARVVKQAADLSFVPSALAPANVSDGDFLALIRRWAATSNNVGGLGSND